MRVGGPQKEITRGTLFWATKLLSSFEEEKLKWNLHSQVTKYLKVNHAWGHVSVVSLYRCVCNRRQSLAPFQKGAWCQHAHRLSRLQERQWFLQEGHLLPVLSLLWMILAAGAKQTHYSNSQRMKNGHWDQPSLLTSVLLWTFHYLFICLFG